MKNLLIASLAIFTILFSGCKSPQPQDLREIVIVSILPQKYFAEKIAGDSYRIVVMVPPGTSPETYEPTAQQMKEIANATVYFAIGHIDFELSLLKKIKSINPSVKFVDTSEGTELISDHFHTLDDGTVHHHGADPHIWLSPKEVMIQAKNMYNSLSEKDPGNAEKYQVNYEKFITEIEAINGQMTDILKDARGRTILVYHPAFGYLARDFGFTQEGIEYEGKNPTPNHLKKIIDIANHHNIRTIFVQKEYEVGYSKTVADEINAEIVILDDLNEDWSNNMIDIATKIKNSISE
jgi:zinc transport system substrate-binding protein